MMDAMPGQATLVDAASFAGMWLVMMAAMMLPSVTPVVLLFRTMQRGRAARGSPTIPTSAFVGGYLVVWALAGIGADLAYVLAQAAGSHTRAGSGAVPYLGAGIIVLAGLYQFSPLKHRCLAHCRSPFHLILHGWRDGRLGALRMGASHGLSCLGCCWGIMAVLFVVGLMNLGWMAALSILIAGEKLAPWGLVMSRLVGILFIGLGMLMGAQPRLFPASGLQPVGTMAASASGVHTSTATAGPYLLTLAVRPPRGSFSLAVRDRGMGMAVIGAHVTMRITGMGAPKGPVVLPALSGRNGKIPGMYGAIVRLMPGVYAVTIDLKGRAATMRIRIP